VRPKEEVGIGCSLTSWCLWVVIASAAPVDRGNAVGAATI
jgi:hypothetical protein